MTVLVRNFIIGFTIWLACLGDLGWKDWTELQICPLFLDLTVVAAVLFARSNWVVFWGGFSGLMTSVIHAEPLQYCIPLFCSVAMIASWSQPADHKRSTMTATAIRSLLILLTLTYGKLLIQQSPTLQSLPPLGIDQLAQVAVSFLFSIVICLLFLLHRRRTVWS